MFDRAFQQLGKHLADDDKRAALFSKWRRIAGRLVLAISILYGLGLAILTLTLSQIGERNVTIAFLLYIPRQVFLIPLAFLLPLGLVFHRPALLIQLICGIGFVFLGMGYQLRGAPPAPNRSEAAQITVLTYNRGQHMNQSLRPFKNRTHPDLISFQESGGRANRFAQAEGYEDLPNGADVGEFTTISRYPILSSSAVEIPLEGKIHRPAARFEIDYPGQRFAFYSVHVISPRGALLSYRGGAFLYGILGIPGTPWNERRLAHQRYWDERIDVTTELMRIIAADPLPTLVVGDFNAPAGGHIHGMVLDHLADAHLEAGSGFGYSFPGVTRNPLSRGGPWMRIDYLFADKKHWRTEWCLTEPDRPSQHRAVAAQFRLLEAGAPATP